MFRSSFCLLVLALVGCGAKPNNVVDSGSNVDTSCGLDCAAQQQYGLQVGRCYQYSSTGLVETPPAIGVLVLPVFTLEGNVKVLPVEYRQGGQIKMRDSFAFKEGGLQLMRREFGSGAGSVTWKDDAGTITGVTLLKAESAAGQTITNTTNAVVVSNNAQKTYDAASYTVTVSAPTNSEKKVPAGTFDNSVTLLIGETPANGADTRRVFSADAGFTVFSTPFALTGGTPAVYSLQKIIEAPDAGMAQDCSN